MQWAYMEIVLLTLNLISMLVLLHNLMLAILISNTSQISFTNQRWMNGLYGSYSMNFRGGCVFVTVTVKCFSNAKEIGNCVQMSMHLPGSSRERKIAGKISALRVLLSGFSCSSLPHRGKCFPEFEICHHHPFLYHLKYICHS